MYRIIDFKRTQGRRLGHGASIEYDPNRSARIALLKYEDGDKAYILAPEGLKAGDKVMSGDKAEPRVGNCMPLRKIPLGMTIHNLEMQPGRGGQICRSAGTSATLTAREGQWAQITLPSGEVRRVQLGMPGHDRHDRQCGPHEHQPGQGGPQALDGPQAAQSRHVDEPGQPSDGRRRRPHRRRPASVQPDRRAGQGRQDAQEAEAVELGDHSPPSAGPALRSRNNRSRALDEWSRTSASYNNLLPEWSGLR